ncbi:hypothetical protein [Cryptosporangium sp. NPDC048952]|uniref:allophanate hydrolase-related protein n=1 Tax=Cryptosporangium sp. NPDC048952 TaxID=3363961 RepID=UPI003722D59B
MASLAIPAGASCLGKAIGAVTLADGRTVRGFLAEPIATHGADDITSHGSWPAALAAIP